MNGICDIQDVGARADAEMHAEPIINIINIIKIKGLCVNVDAQWEARIRNAAALIINIIKNKRDRSRRAKRAGENFFGGVSPILNNKY